MRRRKRTAGRSERHASPKDLRPGLRMKGGVLFDPQVGGFFVIVHTWDNIACRGEPEEWRCPEVFPTEEAALGYYKANIRPALKQMMADTAQEPGRSFLYRQLEE